MIYLKNGIRQIPIANIEQANNLYIFLKYANNELINGTSFSATGLYNEYSNAVSKPNSGKDSTVNIFE